MKTSTQKDTLLEQQLALSAYFEDLFAPVEAPPEPPAKARPKLEVPTPVPPVLESNTNGIPEWAQARFQVLLFEVAGLTLAVPLTKLKGVVRNEHGLTEMPGHSGLFLGITPYQGVQSKVVDTARFVLSQDRVAQLGEDSADRAEHLVVIDEGRWSLACSKIGDVIELESGQVKWRSAAGKRLWLAGTVIDQMCALLDIDELTQQLTDGMA